MKEDRKIIHVYDSNSRKCNRSIMTGSRSVVTKGWGSAGEELDYKET